MSETIKNETSKDIHYDYFEVSQSKIVDWREQHYIDSPYEYDGENECVLDEKKAKEILSDFESEEPDECDIADTLRNEIRSNDELVIEGVSDNSSLKKINVNDAVRNRVQNSYDWSEEDEKETFDIVEQEKISAKSLEKYLKNRFVNPNIELEKIDGVWAIVLKKSN